MESLSIVILAAGIGKRMGNLYPKPLYPIMGKPLIDYTINASVKFSKQIRSNIYVVVGHRKNEVESYLKKYENVSTIYQEEQLGTAHALTVTMQQNIDTDYVMVLYADTPLITSHDLESIYQKKGNYNAVVATFEPEDVFGLGRIKRTKDHFKIIEEKNASSEVKKIREVNSGIYIFKTSFLKKGLHKIGSNSDNEFYLTDIIDNNCFAYNFGNWPNFTGVNDQYQLSFCSKIMMRRKIDKLIKNGVFFIDPESITIDDVSEIDFGTIVHPYTTIQNSKIGKNCILEKFTILRNCTLDDNISILPFSHIESSLLKNDTTIGPFARIRPNSTIDGAKIGNFVEIKNSNIGKNSKVSHLSYVGDAVIGKSTNIGCGFITCNYDGKNKHTTKIGDNCFIGSDSQMIAPLTIGNDCFVASGSTVTDDLPDKSFAISRTKQQTKPNNFKKE